MDNKVIKLIILSSFFPLLLIGCEKTSLSPNNTVSENNFPMDSSPNMVNLYNEVNTKYQTFAKNFQQEEALLKKLQEASKTSPKIIEIQPDIYTQIQKNLNELTTALKSLENYVNEAQKTKIKAVLNLIDTSPSNKTFNLASFVTLLQDNQLEETEICEQIQIPLEIIKDKNDSSCGNFGEKTYQELNKFLTEQLNLIQTEIDSIKSLDISQISNNQQNIDNSQSQELLNNNQLLIVIIITLILNLGSISLIILLILSNKNNKQIIKDLKLELEYYNSQIKKGEISNNKRKHEIKELRQQIIDQFNKTTELKLVNLYKENPQSFFSNYNAIRVSMTKDIVNKVSTGTWEGIIELEVNNRNGEYYIIGSNDGNYYLFLNRDILFNPPTLQQINKSKLFICNGNLSQTLKGSELNIIKPAIVIQDSQKWRLIYSGEIDLNNENIEDNYSLNNYSFIDIESKPVINSVESNIDNQLLPIYQKIQDIDKQLKQLEKASQRIIIAGGKSNLQPKPIPLDKDELINIYNYAPQILAEYATPVSITADTYRRNMGRKVYLEYTINGYYWVILTEDQNIKNYWLLPNANRNIKFYRLKDSIRLLFELKGSKEFRTNILTVTKLAQLEIIPSGLTWLLLQRGCIQNQRSEIINLKKTLEGDLRENLNIFIEEKKKDFEIEIDEILQEAKVNIINANIVNGNLDDKSDQSILDNFDKTFHEVKGIFEEKIQEFKDKLDK
ncbi:hypothetical protein ACN4EE_09195 [Geminocystis sp. CENA526]|uniref:hypothetical protein n=1 Tax=Geminocystis sp. CENA526 TaxID=1355871 RepID=UPI003D6F7B4A